MPLASTQCWTPQEPAGSRSSPAQGCAQLIFFNSASEENSCTSRTEPPHWALTASFTDGASQGHGWQLVG
ncbi:unnamed protein product [Urochloa humidicola]